MSNHNIPGTELKQIPFKSATLEQVRNNHHVSRSSDIYIIQEPLLVSI